MNEEQDSESFSYSSDEGDHNSCAVKGKGLIALSIAFLVVLIIAALPTVFYFWNPFEKTTTSKVSLIHISLCNYMFTYILI